MAFLDELGKTISDKGKEAAKKAKDITEIMQLKTQLNGEKNKLTESYACIGKKYFESCGEEGEENLKDEFLAVKTTLNTVMALEEKIRMLEGSRVCSECGARVERDAKFCSQCGSPMNLLLESSLTDEGFEDED